MATQAIWKGVIGWADIQVPVKLYSAVQDRDIHFHLLHDKDLVRVQQRIVHPHTGQTVPTDEIRRGYAAPKPQHLVVITGEELAALAPKASRDIEVTRFVPNAALQPRWFERPYFLAPDADAGAYFALAEALASAERQGIARWVMRKRQYVGALRAHRGQLLLITLRFADEVLDASKLETPDAHVADAREVRLAESLLDALSGELDLEAFRDDHRERVLELIESKAKGRVVSLKTWKPRRAKPESLAATLQASVEQATTPRPRKERGRARA